MKRVKQLKEKPIKAIKWLVVDKDFHFGFKTKKEAMVFIRANKGLLCLFKVSYNFIESWEK